MKNYQQLYSQEKIVVVVQIKDDTKIWQKRYNKEMTVQLTHMFYLATQQAALPPEQRKMTLELVCKKTGVEMEKFEVKPYLKEIKDEIAISYLEDILAIILERKTTA